MSTVESMSTTERFLQYVAFDTQSVRESTTAPSAEKELALAAFLVDELKALGVEDAEDRRGRRGLRIDSRNAGLRGQSRHRLHRPHGHISRRPGREREASDRALRRRRRDAQRREGHRPSVSGSSPTS